MSDATVPVTGPSVTVPPQSAPSRFARLSDWCNPILVREVQQAVKARTFAMLVLALVTFCVGTALWLASEVEVSERDGRQAFSVALMALVPVALFVVPMSAYQSMRLELRAGIVEQLLLSRLRPHRIIAGKLAAAMVQFGLCLSVLAPLLATTWLLRGVDVPTIGWCLSLSLLACLTTTAAAIATATQGMLPVLQQFANVGVAFGLGMFTVGMMAVVGSGEFVRGLQFAMRSTQWAVIASSFGLVGTLLTVLMAMMAGTMLTHGFENRGTPFRVFLLAVAAIAFGWVLAVVPATEWPQAAIVTAMVLVLAGGLVCLFFVTEQERLSPRQQALVHRWPRASLVLCLVLPGRSRGLLFAIVWIAGLAGIAALFQVGGPRTWVRELYEGFAFAAVYTLLFLSIGRLARGLLPETLAGNFAARGVVPLVLVAAMALPALFDALFAGGVRGWHAGHVLNPFWTTEHFVGYRRDGTAVLLGLGVLTAGLLLMQARSLQLGIREVFALRRQPPRVDTGAPSEPAPMDPSGRPPAPPSHG